MSHALQAVLGLTGMMSCPRFTTFVLWLLRHDFQMGNVKQVIIHRAEKAPAYARTGLQVLRCPFCGVILFICMPGFQVRTAPPFDIILAMRLPYMHQTTSRSTGGTVAVQVPISINTLT